MSKNATIILIAMFSCLCSLGASSYSFKVEVKGQGEPVLLIPGLTCSGDVWEEVVEILQPKCESHIITLPGFAGQPPREEKDNFLENTRRELTAYIQELGQPVTIIGHSLGGFTAMNIAINSPQMVKKIVVVDSYPSMGALFFGKKADLQEVAEAYRAGRKATMDMEETAYANMQTQILRSMIQDSAKVDLALKWSLESDRYTVQQAYEELLLADLRPRMKELSCPALILQAGKGTNYSPKKWKKINEGQYGKNRKILIDRNMDSMHFIMYDQPKWLHGQIIGFLLDLSDHY